MTNQQDNTNNNINTEGALSDKNDKNKKYINILIITAIIILAIVMVYGAILIFLTWPIDEVSISQSGTFGDSFGPLTSLFSGLAFAGLIITIIMQREELELQRHELADTREVLKEQGNTALIQKQIMEEQRDIARVQAFESIFFEMLNSFVKFLTSEVTSEDPFGNKYTGMSAYDNYFKSQSSKNNKCFGELINEMNIEDIKNQYYDLLFSSEYANLRVMPVMLLELFNYLDSNDYIKKSFYVKSIILKLQGDQLYYIFYHALVFDDERPGYISLKHFFEKYGFFSLYADLNIYSHRSLYADTAFEVYKD